MNSLKLMVIMLILAVGLNYGFPEKAREFKTKIWDAIEQITSHIPGLAKKAEDSADAIKDTLSGLPKTTEIAKQKIDAAKQVIISTPLKAPAEKEVSVSNVILTESGVVSWTNRQRINNALPGLKVNASLNAAATLKLRDMFDKQYFEHISPSGVGPGDLAKKVAYEYILIGENLALGNFKDDQDLVQAWMDSPGHRANILNTKYQEIGVAVGRGYFDGRETWLAVQEFGLPLSSCAVPDKNLKDQIDQNQSRLNDLLAELERRKTEIENTSRKSGPEYNQLITDYNERVAVYNKLLEETKKIIVDYNSQVASFNTCLTSYQ